MHCKSYSHFFSKTFQHICVSFDVNFNESLTNDVVSFEQLGPEDLPQRAESLTVNKMEQGHVMEPNNMLSVSAVCLGNNYH